MKRKILALLNIIIPILSLILIYFNTNIDEALLYIIVLTLVIGFIMPFFVLLVTGLTILNESHQKITIIANILSIILNIILIYLLIITLNKNLILVLVTFIIILLLNIINIIYLTKYIKNNPKDEDIDIKKHKDNNNGAII